MFRIIEKGEDLESPIVTFTTFAKCAKWCVDCASLFGTEFEIWYVRRYKTKKADVWLEALYEVLP